MRLDAPLLGTRSVEVCSLEDHWEQLLDGHFGVLLAERGSSSVVQLKPGLRSRGSVPASLGAECFSDEWVTDLMS